MDKKKKHIYSVIIFEKLKKYITENKKDNEYISDKVDGTCYDLIDKYPDEIEKMINKKWLLIEEDEYEKNIILLPKFIEDNKDIIQKLFNELYENKLLVAKFELEIKFSIYKEVKKIQTKKYIDYNLKAEKITDLIGQKLMRKKKLSRKILYYIAVESHSQKNLHSVGVLSKPRIYSKGSLFYLTEDFFISSLRKNLLSLISSEIKNHDKFIKKISIVNKHFLIGNGFSRGLDKAYKDNEILSRIEKESTEIMNELKTFLVKVFDNINNEEINYIKKTHEKVSNSKNVNIKKLKDKNFIHLFNNYYETYEQQKNQKNQTLEIGLEDYFYIFNFIKSSTNIDKSIFVYKQKQEKKLRQDIILSILNKNKALNFDNCEDAKKHDKEKMKKIISGGNIFTTNYDLNIETITGKKVLHLHGGFDLWYKEEVESEIVLHNRNITDGIKLYKEGYKPDIIMNTGEKKTYDIMNLEFIGIERETWYKEKLLMIEGTLIIFGYSGMNDYHINKNIKDNSKIKKIIYIYYSDEDTLNENIKFKICEDFSHYDKEFIFINSKLIWNEFKLDK